MAVIGTCEVQIWIDQETDFIVKGSYLVAMMEDGGLQEVAVHHVFAGFNEDVKVDPPEWLNTEEDDQGRQIISRTDVAYVPFH